MAGQSVFAGLSGLVLTMVCLLFFQTPPVMADAFSRPSSFVPECGGAVMTGSISVQGAIRSLLLEARLSRDRPGRKKAGEKALTEAKRTLDLARRSESSDATFWALLGEWNLLMVQYKGFPAGMSYGKRAEADNSRAISLNSNSAEAHLSRGIERYFKPWFVGGSVPKALKEFQRADGLRPHDPRILSWIGVARNRLHRPGALSYEQEAVRLCPGNSFYLSREMTFNPRAAHR